MAVMDFRITRKKPQHDVSLEEEICRLRKKLEDAVLLENSLSSELVVLSSRLLDEKINEYMRRS